MKFEMAQVLLEFWSYAPVKTGTDADTQTHKQRPFLISSLPWQEENNLEVQ
jgi:hypothetical protein